MNKPLFGALLCALLAAAPAMAQAQVYRDSANTIVPGVVPLVGCSTSADCAGPVSSSNPFPVTGTFSATLGGFQPSASGARMTPLAVTTSDSSGTLPSGAVAVISNVGANSMYCNVNGVAATASDELIPINSWFAFTIPSGITTLHCIGSGGSTTANGVGGSGLATGAGGGSSGGGGGGGTSSSFGSAFPSTGTAIGLSNGTNMEAWLLGSQTSANSGAVVIASDQAAVATKAASGAFVAGSIADLAHGQAAMAASVPVAIANNQSTLPANTAQINGVATLTGAGATGTGAQRVTVSEDTNTIAGSAPGTAGTPSANVLTVQGPTSGGTALPVSAASLPLPSGAATSTLQTTINTTLGSPFQAGGSIGNTSFAATQATAANLNATVIGTGAFATQLTGSTNNINNISGTVSLPTGAATSALQTTGNSTLSTINTTLGSPFQAGGSIGNTAFGATQSGTWNITNISGTVSLPTGAATAANQEVTAAGSSAASAQAIQGVTGGVPVPISGTVSAAFSGFTPTPAYGTPMSVGGTSSRQSLPSGTTVVVYNVGSYPAYVTIGNTSVTATASDDVVFPNCWISYAVGSAVDIAAIETGGATTLNLSGGSGQAAGGCAATLTGASTVTANQGTAGGSAWPVSIASGAIASGALAAGSISSGAAVSGAFATGAIADLALSQGSTTSGEVGNLPLTATTTSAPSYTTAKSNPFSTTTAGGLRSDMSSVGGTALALGSTTSNASIPVVVASDQAAVATKAASAAFASGAVVDLTNIEGVIGAATAPTKMAVGGLVYNSTPLTPSNGQSTAFQGDANGYLEVDVKAGSSGNAAASATGSPVPADADYLGLNIGGTLRGQTGVNPSGSIYAGQADLTSVAGTTTTTAASGTQMVGIEGHTGQSLDAVVGAGTAPTNMLVTGGVYNSGGVSLTNGQSASLQVTAQGMETVVPGNTTIAGTSWNSSTGTSGATQNIINANAYASAYLVQLDQTSTITAGAITFQVSADGTNWTTINAYQVIDPTSATGAQISLPYTLVASTNKQFLIYPQGMAVRMEVSTTMTGTGAFQPYTTPLPMTQAVSLLPSATNQNVNVAQVAGSSTSTAATGVQKVGIVGNAGAAFDAPTGNAVPANNILIGLTDGTDIRSLNAIHVGSAYYAGADLSSVAGTAATTAASGTLMVGIEGHTGATVDKTAAGSASTNSLQIEGVASGTPVNAALNTTPSLANGNGVVPTQGGSVLSATNGGYSNILQGNTALSATNGLYSNLLQGNAVLSATNGLPIAPSPYPATAVPITASNTGTTAATTATLTNVSGHTTYICGYSVRANATAATTVLDTVTGVVTATLSSYLWVAPNASGVGVDEQIFSPCIPASAVSTSIAVVSGAPGTGGLVSVKAWGYSI